MSQTFVHLHVHTHYSIIDGLLSVDDLIAACRQHQMPAVAVTDHFNVFAMVKFYRKALAAGIQPIVGCDVWVTHPHQKDTRYLFTLLCHNQVGYRHLSVLVSRAYQEGQLEGQPTLQRHWLTADTTQGIIALSGGIHGEIGQYLIQKDLSAAQDALTHWLGCFPSGFYCNIARIGGQKEALYVSSVLELAYANNVPVVATNAVCMLSQEDFEAHEARVCIHQGALLNDPYRNSVHTAQQFLRSPQAMSALFEDVPVAIDNSCLIAKRCHFQLQFEGHSLPEFPVPERIGLAHYFDQSAIKGLQKRLGDEGSEQKPYWDRLHMELAVIKKMGFAGYFLIVADFIHWAKTHDIPVGPGRGSGAGSLVAYALEITDIDPMQYDLLFERFLNPERVSMPDFDIDFCMEGRDRVIDYVMERYGRDSVAQIITYGTMAARAVVRDVGRVLAHPYGFVDKLAKLIPFEVGMTLQKALAQEDRLRQMYQEESSVRHLIQLALKLEGTPRNVGKHAGGVVIAPAQLTDFSPVYCEPSGTGVMTQLDKDDIEALGLVKFDFLGLRTLTIIHWTVRYIHQHHQNPQWQIQDIPLDDQKTFDLLKSGQTKAIFQLESKGMCDLIKRLQPNAFDEIVALVALFRPGPLQSGMVDDFIDRKFGRAAVVYPHPECEPILRSTYGVILYQEQVMQIAQVLANYTLGAADVLRRAMGKKKASEMAKQRAIFMAGAVKRQVAPKTAQFIFDLMEKFAGYGFNKSHSVAYALLAYQTAWLKAHYPAEFMAAVLSSDMDNTDKIADMVCACRHMGITVLCPDIMGGHAMFSPQGSNQIVYGLGAIKGLGASAIEHLLKAREANGPFKDLGDLCRRIDIRKVNRRALEALIASGALDCLGVDRGILMASVDLAIQSSEQNLQQAGVKQGSLLNALLDESHQAFTYQAGEPWSDKTRLAQEKKVLGFYLSGHPIHALRGELMHMGAVPIGSLDPSSDQHPFTISGYITAVRHLVTKKGKKIAFMRIEDETQGLEVGVFGDLYHEKRSLLLKDRLLVVSGRVRTDDYSGGFSMMADQVHSLPQARSAYATHLKVTLSAQEIDAKPGLMAQIKSIMTPCLGGRVAVWLQYTSDAKTGACLLVSEWKVLITEALIEQLSTLMDHPVVIGYGDDGEVSIDGQGHG